MFTRNSDWCCHPNKKSDSCPESIFDPPPTTPPTPPTPPPPYLSFLAAYNIPILSAAVAVKAEEIFGSRFFFVSFANDKSR